MDVQALQISQQANSPGGYGSVATRRLSTTVSGLGTLSLSTSDVRESRSIWLMLEELK